MKKKIIHLMLGAAATLVFITIQAQPSLQSIAFYSADKAARGAGGNGAALTLRAAYPKIASQITQAYPASAATDFYESDNAIHVWVAENGEKVHVAYNEHQQFLYAITELKMDALPAWVADMVRAHYCGYKFYHARSVRTNEGTLYQVVVAQKDKFLRLNIAGDEIAEAGILENR